MRMRALIGATLVAWSFLPAVALVASADEGPRPQLVVAGPLLRPPLTVLRAAERAPSATVTIEAPKKQLIVLIGGYGSDSRDGTFDALTKRIEQDSGYEVVRFGRDF